MSRPFIPVPGVFKVQLIYTLFSQRIENVFHVKSGAGLTVADADRIEAVFANWWNTSARAQVSSNASLVLIVFDALDSAAGLHREYTSGWTAAGGHGSGAFPGSVTTSIKLASPVRGRSYRGRIYWPAIPSTVASNGLLSAAYRDALATSVNLLRTSLSSDAASDKLVVVSYRADGVWRTEGVATEITSASAHLNIDSQRRRLVGRGL